MKIRSDFVTNSSSSSFIIATNNKEAISASNRLFEDKINSKVDINNYFSEIGENPNKLPTYLQEIYDDMLEFYEKGYEVFYTFEVDYVDPLNREISDFLKDNNSVVIINSDEI